MRRLFSQARIQGVTPSLRGATGIVLGNGVRSRRSLTAFTGPWRQWWWWRFAWAQRPRWPDGWRPRWPGAPRRRLTPSWRGCWWAATGSGGSEIAAWSPGRACWRTTCWRTTGSRRPERWWGWCRWTPVLWRRRKLKMVSTTNPPVCLLKLRHIHKNVLKTKYLISVLINKKGLGVFNTFFLGWWRTFKRKSS